MCGDVEGLTIPPAVDAWRGAVDHGLPHRAVTTDPGENHQAAVEYHACRPLAVAVKNAEIHLVVVIWHGGNEATHDENSVVTLADDKVPVTFHDTVPVAFHDMGLVTFDDKDPVTFGDKLPVTFGDKVPVTFDDMAVTVTDVAVAPSGGHCGLTRTAVVPAWTGVVSSLIIVSQHGVCPALPTGGATDVVLGAG